jgi:hypothetical protein
MWYSHQDVRTGSKVGGKKKAHTAFYNKKREISYGKKRETTDRRKEKQLIEEKRNIR